MLIFYDTKECVESDTPSKISLWVDRGGYIHEIWGDKNSGLSVRKLWGGPPSSAHGVVECPPSYVYKFFKNRGLLEYL